MIDFPNSPEDGQVVTAPNGVAWIWSGSAWLLGESVSAAGGVVSYVHNQTVVADTWVINHSLGWYPNVTVVDSAGTTVEGDLTQVSPNQLQLEFSGAFTGVAYLS